MDPRAGLESCNTERCLHLLGIEAVNWRLGGLQSWSGILQHRKMSSPAGNRTTICQSYSPNASRYAKYYFQLPPLTPLQMHREEILLYESFKLLIYVIWLYLRVCIAVILQTDIIM